MLKSPLLYAVAGLCLLLLVMEEVRPCFFLHDDNADLFVPAYIHDFRVLTETGRLAEVNYYQHSGEPFLEQGLTAVLYPFIYPGVALAKGVSGDLRWSIEWIAAEHLTLGLLGFYFWARQNGVTQWLAALGGLAWVLNPFVLIASVSWIFVAYVAAWLPWLFGAFDRLWMRPSLSSALGLGSIAGLFFLQGYVQWLVYAFSFLGVYALLVFVMQKSARRLVLLYYLAISALAFLILILPLLGPMWHATQLSAERADSISVEKIMYSSIPALSIFSAQILHFRGCVFGATTAILFAPALVLAPVVLLRLVWDRPETRRRVFPLLVLASLAMIFSTSWYELLAQLPLLDRLRWPFKVFVFAHFFLIAALVVSLSAWASGHAAAWWKAGLVAVPCLVLVIGAELGVALSSHDRNVFSPWSFPASTNPLVPGMDPLRGRVASFGNDLPKSYDGSYLTHLYATYFAFPSLGGYNPLVGGEQLSHALYLDFPNFCTGTITRDFQEEFESRAVRYWIVDPHSTQFTDMKTLPGFKLLDAGPDRVIFEDTLASPVVFSAAAPAVPCVMRYAGNSLLIQLDHVSSPVEISVGPADGWWYRIDHGPWLKPVYENEHLKVDFGSSVQLLEISFFDPRFWGGMRGSFALLLLLGVWVMAGHTSVARRLHPS